MFSVCLWSSITSQLPFGCGKSRKQLLEAGHESHKRKGCRSDCEPVAAAKEVSVDTAIAVLSEVDGVFTLKMGMKNGTEGFPCIVNIL